MPQKHLEHHQLTAPATVDGNDINMLEDNGFQSAYVSLTVVNIHGFDLPSTGDRSVWMYGLVGVLLMTDSVVSIIVTNRKKSTQEFCVGNICVEETIVKTLEFHRKCWRDHGWINL